MRFKTLITSFILVLLGLFLNSANSKRFESVSFQKKQNIKRPSQLAAEPTLSWLTFMGSTYDDEGNGIAVDDSGNIYVVGASRATWGTPVNPHTGYNDAFVAKLDSNGIMIWNTFMGCEYYNEGNGIAIDDSGNIYVMGTSSATWGIPVNPHTGYQDAFVAKLDSNGVMIWNTFMGSADGFNPARGIAFDASGNVYVAGYSRSTWGTPVNAHAGNHDGFVAKLDSNGVMIWNTFMGSADGFDPARGIAVDVSGNVYVAGYSNSTWGTPVNAHAGNHDGFVAKLDTHGVRKWNTFMGSADNDYGNGIAVDVSGNVYVSGSSLSPWGNPKSPYIGNYDAFIAKFSNSGIRQWNTFVGFTHEDYNYYNEGDCCIKVDNFGCVYMSCTSSYHDYELEWINGFAAKVHNSGRLQWIALLGDDFLDHDDYCRGIVVDNSWNIYVTGYSDFSWGTPINPHSVQYGDDAFVVKLTQQLEPEINVKYGSTELPDGSKIDFGIGSTENSKSTIFSVENGGDDNLILNGLPVIEITGADAGQFYVTKQPDASITPGGSTTFEITFAPTSSGEKTAKVAISSNDSDENPYDIHLTGVCDNPPRVNITSPEEGEAVYSQVDVKANATDDFGVEKVDFYIDGVLKKTDTSAPYSYLWNAGIESVGYHTLKARTFDTIGQTGEDRVTVRTNRIVMGIVARRNEDKAWIIKKEYGEIVLGFENPHFVPVFKFVIYRKVDGGDYLSIKEIPVSEIQTGSFIYLDKYLEKDKTYTYKAEAFNSAGKVIAVSGERTI